MNDQYLLFYDSVGTLLSKGDGTSPLTTVFLNASTNEVSGAMKVTAKFLAGYKSLGDTLLSISGASAGKWTICATADGTFGSSLTISTIIDETTGVDFYVKAQATSDESPVLDTSVDFAVVAKAQPAAA